MVKVKKTVKTQKHNVANVTTKTSKSSFMEKYNKANDYVWAMWGQPWLTGLVGAVVLPLTVYAIILVASKAHSASASPLQIYDLVATGLAILLGLAFLLYGAVVCPVLYALRYGKQAAVKVMVFTLLWLALFTMFATLLSLNSSFREPKNDYNCGFEKNAVTHNNLSTAPDCLLYDKPVFQGL